MSDSIKHYGTPRHSGRYPWGSGKNPQRHQILLNRVKELQDQGLTETQIAKALGFKSTVESRAAIRISKNEIAKEQLKRVRELSDKGMGATAIARELGLKNESSVRSILKKKLAVEGDLTTATANLLKDNLKKYKYIDIGDGIENNLFTTGITKERLKTAVAMLEQEGYVSTTIQVEQLGTKKGQKTYIKVLGPEGTTYTDVNQNKDQISSTWFLDTHTEDGGYSFRELEAPRSVDSKRIYIRYAEDGGTNKDGVIEIRPGVEDVNLGLNKYAQVRIAVDDKYYLKGMAVNSNSIPEGYDILVNSNKPSGTPNEKVFKEMKFDENGKLDTGNPFGALIKPEEKLRQIQKHYIDKDGKEQLNCVNVVNEQGDWGEWRKTISSQFLSKQLPETAKKQLTLTYAEKQEEFEEIKTLTNPIVKKAMLQEFADNSDASAVSLKATGFAGQRSYVILPVNSLKENEVYAPNYKNGEQIVLVRFPHAGRFEIPLLKVNNNNKEARETLGVDAADAVGINKKVADQLSGADFDGDTVVAIPIRNVNIKTEKAIKELREYEPKVTYAIPDEMKFTKEQEKLWVKDKQAALKQWSELANKIPRMTSKEKGRQMGEVSNLITDMTLKEAPQEDIIKAVKHSMTVIDAEKHYLDWKQSELDNDIQALKKRYQQKENGNYGGASTLISKAKGRYQTEELKEITTLTPKNRALLTEKQIKDFEEGKRVYVKTGKEHYVIDKKAGVDENGKPLGWVKKPNMTEGTKMFYAEDAMDLSSGTIMEKIYGQYANKLKSIANESRKILRTIKPYRQDKEAAKEYKAEVQSLREKLNEAQKNRPLERAAQNYANNKWKSIRESNREMDKAEEKKVKGKLLEEGRRVMGAGKKTIKITDREWEAIQKKAVSSNQLEAIIANADKDRLKELALPRSATILTTSKINVAKAKINAGYTQAEVAEDLGISVSTLNNALK